VSPLADRVGRLTKALAAGHSPLTTRRLLRLTDITLRTEGLVAARAKLLDAAPRRSTTAAAPASIVDHVAAVARTLRPTATCLRQALVVEALLASSDLDGRTQIGVRRHPISGGWESHAWVELDGRPIVDRAQTLSSYRTLALAHPGGEP